MVVTELGSVASGDAGSGGRQGKGGVASWEGVAGVDPFCQDVLVPGNQGWAVCPLSYRTTGRACVTLAPPDRGA